jgi:phosphate transport system protein
MIAASPVRHPAAPARREVPLMREVFHQSLEDVQSRLVEIADLVTVAVDKATRAFGTSDVGLAEEVIEDDQIIDDKAIALDELAIEILARQQPVARDLRIVVAALRVSASLERMGDIAEHIAQLTRMRFPERAIPKGLKSTFIKMGELDVEVSRTLTELLRSEDLTLVERLRSLEEELDDLHLAIFEKVLGETWKGEAAATVDATLASRYHERFADHAVSVAKKVAYLATGDWTTDTDSIATIAAAEG